MRATLEESILKNWHIKLAVLSALVSPAVSATGAYFSIQNRITSETAHVSEKVNNLELRITESYADKNSLRAIDDRTRKMENDIVEIKTMLRTRLR